jgi:hypothetical protein
VSLWPEPRPYERGQEQDVFVGSDTDEIRDAPDPSVGGHRSRDANDRSRQAEPQPGSRRTSIGEGSHSVALAGTIFHDAYRGTGDRRRITIANAWIPLKRLVAGGRHVEGNAIRIARIDSVDDTLAFLQQLSAADRQRLAASPTRLARFADVRTPDEAMARLCESAASSVWLS